MERKLLHFRDISFSKDQFDPSCVDEIVFPSEAAEGYLRRWSSRATATRNLLIYGPPGSGKTRAACLLAQVRCAEFLDADPISYVECEPGTFDELLQIRKNESTIFGQCVHPSFESLAILDEVDNFRASQQKQLKMVMERADQSYILLTNHLKDVDVGLRNRCFEIPWFIPPFERCRDRLASLSSKVCTKSLDERTLRTKVYTTAGWRQMIRNLDVREHK